jgi:hypothetical protein
MLQVQVTAVKSEGDHLRVSFNLVASGNYVTGGDTVDFTKATIDPTATSGKVAAAVPIQSDQAPVEFDVWDSGGNIANGVFPVIGAAQNNNKVKFTSAFNTELGAGGYPPAITGSKLQGEAIFPKFI